MSPLHNGGKSAYFGAKVSLITLDVRGRKGRAGEKKAGEPPLSCFF
jgi:hypothetical protein